MIAVDTSAVVAILLREPERDSFIERLFEEDGRKISVASVLECSIVLRAARRLSETDAERTLDSFLDQAELGLEVVTLDDVRLAREAHQRFGKGTGHPAQLNFGDCFSYALARRLHAPLLYKGGDFIQTDIASAL